MGRDDDRLSDILRNHGQGLTGYINSHKKAVRDLITLIKYHVEFERIFWGGSIGKGTSLGPDYKPDFDIILFFYLHWRNDYELQDLIKRNMKVIAKLLQESYSDRYKVLYVTPFAIGVLIRQTQTKVDLIPAVHFSQNRARQYDRSMVGVLQSGFNEPWANPSYAETSVYFMEQQEPFVRDFVKLAKYWNRNCVKMSGLSGRSVIVETVAIYAAQEEMDSAGPDGYWSYTRALGKFLNYMADDWRNLSIVVYTDAIRLPRRVVDQAYKMRRTSGVVLDPVNPYRNFLDDPVAQNKWTHFQKAAWTSLKMFREGERIESTIGF